LPIGILAERAWMSTVAGAVSGPVRTWVPWRESERTIGDRTLLDVRAYLAYAYAVLAHDSLDAVRVGPR